MSTDQNELARLQRLADQSRADARSTPSLEALMDDVTGFDELDPSNDEIIELLEWTFGMSREQVVQRLLRLAREMQVEPL